MKNLLLTVTLVTVLTLFYGALVFLAIDNVENVDRILNSATIGK